MIRKLLLFLLAASFVHGSGPKLAAQRLSPHDKVSVTLGGKTVTIEYGRPYLKHPKTGEVRKLGMPNFVPWGQWWRTGADEATTLTTEVNLTIGSLKVPAGKYTLYTLPNEKAWKLIVNKQTGQWGTDYNADQDLGRVDMQVQVKTSDKPTEQFTLSFDQAGESKATLKLAFGNVVASVPFTAAP